jgi:hypothetical protein
MIANYVIARIHQAKITVDIYELDKMVESVLDGPDKNNVGPIDSNEFKFVRTINQRVP